MVHSLGPRGDGHWEGAWVRPFASLREPPREAGSKGDSSGNTAAKTGSRFYQTAGVPPLSHQSWELTCPPASEPQPWNTPGPAASCPRVPRPTARTARTCSVHQWLRPLCKAGPGSQPGRAQPYLGACHIGGPALPTQGAPRDHIPQQRGARCWTP